MFCGTCGKQIRDDSKFCEFCGTPVAAGQVRKAAVRQEKEAQHGNQPVKIQPKPLERERTRDAGGDGMSLTESKRKSKKSGVLLAAGAVVILAAAGVIWMQGSGKTGNAEFEETAIAAATEQGGETEPTAETEGFRFAEGEEATGETEGANVGSETEPATEPAGALEETEAPEPIAEVLNPEAYILPDCATRFYTDEELSALSPEDLRLARNEIYARHGRMFQTEDLNAYFSQQPWYVPLYTAEEMNQMGDSYLNMYETANRDRILQVESARKGERPMQVVNCQESITLRNAPSTTAGEICQIPLGAVVTYKGAAEGQFYEIEYQGYRGYAIGSFFSELS